MGGLGPSQPFSRIRKLLASGSHPFPMNFARESSTTALGGEFRRTREVGNPVTHPVDSCLRWNDLITNSWLTSNSI